MELQNLSHEVIIEYDFVQTFLSLFKMKITANVTKGLHQDRGLSYLHLPIFFLYMHSPVLLQNKKFLCRPSQTGYEHERNMHTSDVTHTRKSLHGIDPCMLKLFEFVNFSLSFLSCAWLVLLCITSCEGHKL